MANTSLGAQTLLQVIRLKRAEVVGLLLKHGVVISPNTSDMEIAVQVTNLCKTSKSFYDGFTKLIADKNVVKSIYSNMDGNYLGITDTMKDWCSKGDNAKVFPDSCKDSTTTTSTTPSASSGGSKWLTEGLNLLQTGFNGYLQLDTNKTKRALAEASVKVSETGGSVNNNVQQTPSSNTSLYVILALVGFSVIGLVVYLATKKKA